ncbi:hypothetical protein C8R46DRAFT_1069756, partial [Mycena filopes]
MGDVHDILGETSRAGRSRTQSITRDTRIRKAAPSAPKSKKRKDAVQNSSGEEFDFTGVELTPAVKSSKAKGKSSKAKGKEKETTSEADGRSAKRRKLIPDLSFLEASPPHLVQPTSTASGFALPSADLLKCIHHFACNYYSERGQLLNSGATYSREKVERRLAKLAAQNKTRSQDGDSDQENASGKTKTFRSNEKHRDMYRMLDGSALLVLGMLLQEHVGRLLTPRVPEGWEQGLEEWKLTRSTTTQMIKALPATKMYTAGATVIPIPTTQESQPNLGVFVSSHCLTSSMTKRGPRIKKTTIKRTIWRKKRKQIKTRIWIKKKTWIKTMIRI